MIRYIIIYGAPDSGRSIFAKEVSRYLPDSITDSLEAPLRHFIATALGVQFSAIPRDKILPELGGLDIEFFIRRFKRDMAIEDMLSRCLVHRVLRYPMKMPKYVIVDDVEQPEEMHILAPRIVVHVSGKRQRPFIPIKMEYDFYVKDIEQDANTWKTAEEIAGLILDRCGERKDATR
jgi:hypothetical protein